MTLVRLTVLPACLLLAFVAAPSLRAQTFANPVVGGGADPWAVQWKGQYFYTRTTGSDVRVSRSPWLQSLNSNSRTVWNPPTSTPYGNNIWAPELHRLNDKWYMYVSADDGADANHRMFVLEGDSSDPQGSYTLKGQISIPSNRWAIDGTVMEHGGKNYFIWSGRTSGTTVDIGSSQSLYIAEMSNPWTLTGTRTRISSPTFTWETHGHPVNEGPEILRNPSGDVFLTYSASAFETPEYAIGALKLTGSNPVLAGSWTKLAQPLFDQGNGVEGTGHASFVKSPDGTQDWIVYHARTAPGAPRDVRIQPFTFAADGTPQFGEPIPTGQITPAPSGVPLVTFVPNQSFERGGNGWLDDFHAFGDAGATDNDGTTFSHIAGGDGPRVGYLTVGAAAGDSGIYQDIGPAHAGTYTLSMGLALGDDAAATAALDPATFLLRLERVGLHPGGSANEADKSILGEFAIESSDLLTSDFRYFDLSAGVPESAVGSWLRVAVYAPTDLTANGTPWSVKLDGLSLDWSTPAASDVPEPGTAAAAALLCGSLLLVGRRQRRYAAGDRTGRSRPAARV